MIYLASQSPRRKEILKQMGLRFRVVPSSYHEKPSRKPPRRLVMDHAVGKVQQAKVKAAKGIILGADTIVYCQGKVLGKPKNLSAAYKMLRMISGRPHDVYTGIALKDLETGFVVSSCEVTQVFVKKLSESQIRDYCQKVPPLDKAGAYAIQLKPKIVTKIKGSHSNVVGLPKELFRKLLKRL